MDERSALALLDDRLDPVGDDAAIVDGQALTTDMLHESTDFPEGTTRYTAGWRAVGASLSDLAAMGATATAAVAVYAAPTFDRGELEAFVDGASDVCASVGGEYVGGDLDDHQEFTVATTALGRVNDPVFRSGARPGDAICVTGTLGRSGAAVRLFERGNVDRANDLFRFDPRIGAGRALAPYANAMMDSSDGLARSLHQISTASGCGVDIDSEQLPIDAAVDELARSEADRLELGAFFGEDFELVCTIPADALEDARSDCPIALTRIGSVTTSELLLDGEPLPDRGYTHGGE